MKRNLIRCGVDVLVIAAVIGLATLPGAVRKDEARAVVDFTADGVTVERTGRSIPGSGNLILVRSGMGMLMFSEFLLTNSRGDEQLVELCNGHPDYWLLDKAVARRGQPGYHIRATFLSEPLKDDHIDENHLGFQRYLRFEEIK